jgi:hypothetical protein
MQSQQIRGALPRTVTPVSLRYPQLLWVLTRFHRRDAVRVAKDLRNAGAIAPSGLTMRQRGRRTLHRSGTAGRQRRRAVHQFKTTVWIGAVAVRVR